MNSPPDIDTLADHIIAAMPRLDATDQRICLTLLRQLARGAPVTTHRLAVEAELPEAQIIERLDRVGGVFRDRERRVVGFMGLTLVEMGNHRIHLDGRSLAAWCAWDTLFLAELLGESISVSSRSPVRGVEISLSVTSSGPTGLRPPETVVSFVIPKAEFGADVIQSFCHFVHFFASTADSEAWAAQHPDAFVLSVNDAHRLGQLTNRAVFGDALVSAGGS